MQPILSDTVGKPQVNTQPSCGNTTEESGEMRSAGSPQDVTATANTKVPDAKGDNDGPQTLQELQLEPATKIRSKLRLSAVLAGLFVRKPLSIFQSHLSYSTSLKTTYLHTNIALRLCLANPLHIRPKPNNRSNRNPHYRRRIALRFWICMDWRRLPSRKWRFGAGMGKALRYLGTEAHAVSGRGHVFCHVYSLRTVN